jgi:hypothetical protein
MRALPLLVLVLLPACATTTDELFTEANISGDFTAVNARLEAENEEMIRPANCRAGSVLVCEPSRVETCSCVPTVRFHDLQREVFIQRGKKYGH